MKLPFEAISPSSFKLFSIIFERSSDAFSSSLIVHPIFPLKKVSEHT